MGCEIVLKGAIYHSGRGESSLAYKCHVISHRFNRSHRIPRAFIYLSNNLRIGVA